MDADQLEKKTSSNKVKKGSSDEGSGESDPDPLVEIQVNNLVRESQISRLDVRNFLVRCSACGSQINHHDLCNFFKHRQLKVITCRDCYYFYGSSEFSQDENGVYNYCTWCGQGGKLIVCDYCPKGFCNSCIRRNFGRAEVAKTQKEGWKCYCCDPSLLKPKQRYYRLIRYHAKREKSKKERKTATTTLVRNNLKDTISPPWMQDAFNNLSVACLTFEDRLKKLREIESSRSKSLYHVIKKMDYVLNQHKNDLKSILNKVTNQYSKYVSEQKSKEIITIDDGVSDSKLSVENSTSDVKLENSTSDVKHQNSTSDVKLNGTASELLENKTTTILEAPNIINSEVENTVTDVLDKTMEQVVDFLEENEKAKKLLFDSSSESESKSNPLFESESSDDENKAQIKSASRKLKFSTSDGISDLSEDEIASKTKSKSSKNFENEIQTFSESTIGPSKLDDFHEKIFTNNTDYNDPKLKLKAVVALVRCSNSVTNLHIQDTDSTSESKKNLKAESNSLNDMDKLEKVISNLGKFPEAKTVKKEYKPKPSIAPKKKPKIEKENESSSSICFSSEDEDESSKKDVPVVKALNPNLLAKKDLLQSDSSDISSEDSDFQESKIKKKNKSAKKKAVSSDDSFKPLKKKKYDKLLSARLKISDSDESKEKSTASKKSVKRKVISSDDNEDSKERKRSSSEHTTSTDSETEKKKKKRKLKRIKKMDSSSEEGSDAKDKDGTPGKGRKNIKKIISTKKLTEETKEAQMEEKERKKRIADRQKLYNKITDTSADGKETITRKLVLEVDPDSKEELVEISPDIVEKLKVHQVNGVKFMWESTIESLKKLNDDNDPGSGCILAHCMGLGKTLQVITFLHTCMVNKHVAKKIRTAMVVCPYNTILNWAHEFEIWQEDCDEQIQVHQLSAAKDNYVRLDILKWWQREGGVLILSYDILRRLAAPGGKGGKSKIKAKMKSKFLEMLIDPGADIVVCDEGHVLKNEASAISKTMAPMRTKRRIVLTGTPLQNNLQEYHCMLSFVKPHLLGTSKEFRNRFVNPIQNGQYENSTAYDVKLMKKRTHILHKLLDGCVQRCDYSSLAAFLPPKHEFVISVKLSEVQIKMYRYYLDNVTEVGKVSSKGATLFQDFNHLRCIWTHPCMCRTSFERAEYRRMLNDWKVEENEEEEEFINDESEGSYHSSPEENANNSTSSSSGTEVVKKYKTRSRTKNSDDIEEIGESSKANDEPEEKEWFDQFVSKDDVTNFELSGKLIILMEILKECENIGDKIIVFSQSLLTLDMIEEFLAVEASKAELNSDPQTDVIGSWCKGRDYFRMDGSTSADFRKSYIDMFNDPNKDRARLFLISTKAGGLGTNLVGANRVVIFDASWNPSHDVQAIFRVYRFGQKKPVYIYRLLAQGTMEEKIYDRQITKLSMSFRVVDEQQIERHFTSSDLAELYSFNPDSTANRPTPLVPKDRLLAELLIKKQGWIVTYHEHDSLLQHETEADLTEEERQAAWQEYENEKDDVSFNNPALSNFNDFCKEPDVNEANYEGTLLPTVHTIYNSINESLKQKYPGISAADMSSKITEVLLSIRSVFLNKQVDFLRRKQEFFAKGSVPTCINKYLAELANLLKNLSLLINKLREHLQALYAKAHQNSNPSPNLNPNPSPNLNPNPNAARMMYTNAVNRAAYAANAQQMFRANINLQNMQSQLRGNLGPTPGYLRQMPLNQRMYLRNYLRNPTFQTFATNVQPKKSEEPIVTESDESQPTGVENSNIPVAPNKSSVVIEEIT